MKKDDLRKSVDLVSKYLNNTEVKTTINESEEQQSVEAIKKRIAYIKDELARCDLGDSVSDPKWPAYLRKKLIDLQSKISDETVSEADNSNYGIEVGDTVIYKADNKEIHCKVTQTPTMDRNSVILKPMDTRPEFKGVAEYCKIIRKFNEDVKSDTHGIEVGDTVIYLGAAGEWECKVIEILPDYYDHGYVPEDAVVLNTIHAIRSTGRTLEKFRTSVKHCKVIKKFNESLNEDNDEIQSNGVIDLTVLDKIKQGLSMEIKQKLIAPLATMMGQDFAGELAMLVQQLKTTSSLSQDEKNAVLATIQTTLNSNLDAMKKYVEELQVASSQAQ